MPEPCNDPPRFSKGRVDPYGGRLLPVCCPMSSLTCAVGPSARSVICGPSSCVRRWHRVLTARTGDRWWLHRQSEAGARSPAPKAAEYLRRADQGKRWSPPTVSPPVRVSVLASLKDQVAIIIARQLTVVLSLILILQPHLPFATVVVCAPCSGLMASAPPGPGQHEAWLDRGGPHQRHQQPADLGHRQREQTEPAVQAAVSPFVRSGLVAWARVTARNAWASSARVMWRYQPGHLRTS